MPNTISTFQDSLAHIYSIHISSFGFKVLVSVPLINFDVITKKSDYDIKN